MDYETPPNPMELLDELDDQMSQEQPEINEIEPPTPSAPAPEDEAMSPPPNDEPSQEMTLAEFQSLPPEAQAEIWPTIQATKRDTSMILQMVSPGDAKGDPLLPLLQQIVEVTIRTEQKLDKVTTNLIDAGVI
jgi:hypothetical protein